MTKDGHLCLSHAHDEDKDYKSSFSSSPSDTTGTATAEAAETIPANNNNWDGTIGEECRDSDDACAYWSEIGECEANPAFMLTECPQSCEICDFIREGGDLSNLIEQSLSASGREEDDDEEEEDFLVERDVNKTPYGVEQTIPHPPEGLEDDDEEEDGVGDLLIGEHGHDDDDDDGEIDHNNLHHRQDETPDVARRSSHQHPHWQVLEVLRDMRRYMEEQVQVESKFDHVRDQCKNRDRDCALWAATGECEKNPAYMTLKCAPVCQTCELLDYETRCPIDPSTNPNIFEPGDIHRFFVNLTTFPEFQKYRPVVHSMPNPPIPHLRLSESSRGAATTTTFTMSNNHGGNDDLTIHSDSPTPLPNEDERDDGTPFLPPAAGPWIVSLEQFLTEEECDRLIEYGYAAGFERSADVGAMQFDGSFSEEVSDSRTSTTAWCGPDCSTNGDNADGGGGDAVIGGILQRIQSITGIPESHSEYLQILRYEVGQFYRVHHDYIEGDTDRIEGVRLLTVFLYLNDVDAGGGTNFPYSLRNLTIYPKRGRALVWPSVLDDDPDQIDHRTYHQALPVERGIKYGANAWLHQRDYKGAYSRGCA